MARIASLFPLLIGGFVLGSTSALGTPELLQTYLAPQALAMGNALTADASGFAALFHNPAGLAKAPLREWEVTPLALEGTFSTSFLGTAAAGQSLSINRLLTDIQAQPGNYHYVRGNFLPSITGRGFGLALLAAQEGAAVSDGSDVSIRSGTDYGIVMGAASNFAANMLKVGVTAKALWRNELRGTFAHSALDSAAAIAAQQQEGLGIGADVGAMITLPVSYLPTLGFSWRDVGDTQFHAMNLLNASSNGAPAPIRQSFAVGVSATPALARGVRATFSAEIRHLERIDLPLQKRLHFGFQFVTRKRLFIWAGLNQLLPTGGIGLRVKGGDLEVASYAQDVGQGATFTDNRRFILRYTVGF